MPKLCYTRVGRYTAAPLLTLVGLIACAQAGTVYDLNPSLPPPTLPTIVSEGNTPVYITNSFVKPEPEPEPEPGDDDTENPPPAARADDAPGEGESGEEDGDGEVSSDGMAEMESLRIGARSQVHMGYGPAATATGGIGVTVQRDVVVEGLLRVGKGATRHEAGMPNAGVSEKIDLTIGGDLTVTNGGLLVAAGASDGEPAPPDEPDPEQPDPEPAARAEGEDPSEPAASNPVHSVITANALLLDGGTARLEDFATLRTTGTDATRAAVTVRNGGALVLDGGVPPGQSATDGEEWIFKGLDVSAGGSGIVVENGGMLTTGAAGGAISGTAGQRLDVMPGGVLSAAGGTLKVTGIDEVVVSGKYLAGVNQDSGEATYLDAPDAKVSFTSGSQISLGRGLHRSLNRTGLTGANAVVVKGKTVDVLDGLDGMGEMATGMGKYGLERGRDETSGQDYLRVGWLSGGVRGDLSEADRAQFGQNMRDIWGGGIRREWLDTVYDLSAAETPLIQAYGDAGTLNQSILEAFVDGENAPVGTVGYADRGLFELYTGGAHWGVNSVAMNTGEEFMAQLDRRTDRIGAEMDRLGEGWVGGLGYASCAAAPDIFVNRVWAGGFGRDEKSERNGNRSGHKYRPGGVIVGFDREVGRFSLGAAGAYGKGNYEDRAALSNKSKITSYSGGLYGSYHSGSGLFVSTNATYSRLDNKLSDVRGGMRRRADYNSYSWTLGAKIGYDIYLADRVTLTPAAGIVRAHASNESHDEYLNDLGVLRVGQLRRNSLTTPLELNLGFDLVRTSNAILRLTGTLGYAYDFKDDCLEGGFLLDGLASGGPMPAEGIKAGRNRFNGGVGVVFTGKRLDLGARYDYFQRRDQRTHQARGTFGVKF